MRAFIILTVYNVISIAACGNIFHGNTDCMDDRIIQEGRDQIIDSLLKEVTENPDGNITVMEDILGLFYKGVKDEEFGIGAGYDLRNGTLSGIIDPVAHRLRKSEWEMKYYIDSRADNYMWRVRTEIRHPRLLVTYNNVSSIGRPRASGRLIAEFTGVRYMLEISRRIGPYTDEYRIDLNVVFAEDSSIRMSGWDLSRINTSHEFESQLRKELKSSLNETLMKVYNELLRR